jgi:hypothetical protein
MPPPAPSPCTQHATGGDVWRKVQTTNYVQSTRGLLRLLHLSICLYVCLSPRQIVIAQTPSVSRPCLGSACGESLPCGIWCILCIAIAPGASAPAVSG